MTRDSDRTDFEYSNKNALFDDVGYNRNETLTHSNGNTHQALLSRNNSNQE